MTAIAFLFLCWLVFLFSVESAAQVLYLDNTAQFVDTLAVSARLVSAEFHLQEFDDIRTKFRTTRLARSPQAPRPSQDVRSQIRQEHTGRQLRMDEERFRQDVGFPMGQV